MPGKICSDTVYKVCAILGTLVVVITPYLGWQQVLSFEDKATAVFEARILTSLDLKNLKSQFNSIKSVLESDARDPTDPDAPEYTPAQMQHLLDESETLNKRIEDTLARLKALDHNKSGLVADIKLLFASTLILTVIGMVVAIFGFIGWVFHLRIFEERRRAPRSEDDT